MPWTPIEASAIVPGDALLLTMLDDDQASLVTARCLAVLPEGIELELIAVAKGSAGIRPYVTSVFPVADVNTWMPKYRPEASPEDRTGADRDYLLRELKRIFHGRTTDIAHAVDPTTRAPIGLLRVAPILKGRVRVEEWMLRATVPAGAGRRPVLGEYDRVTPYRTSTAEEREVRLRAERDEKDAVDPQVAVIVAAFPGIIVREGRLRGRGGGPSIIDRMALATTGAPQRPATIDDDDDHTVEAVDD